jgi:hypothetical protein
MSSGDGKKGAVSRQKTPSSLHHNLPATASSLFRHFEQRSAIEDGMVS